ncbi:Mor transcription activator family protein [Campylobacter sp. FOBRC14]|uniref:Mor transcription activator family protein n=1 Tax=Campylobacter sp. FOBRC14 TaxID=936554 RepID=UPI00027A36A9|nr:Mor transcription activator family protein [Campylobacter sp. FOBRC14]EJP75566.1 Mor transcription activator domain protein [Campylobacter sp. FOBRC14]
MQTATINNFDLFVEFYNKVKESSDISEIIKEYGGANIYIPSYKATFRNQDILRQYDEGIRAGKNSSVVIRELAQAHNLSYNTISSITKEVREPSLFDSEN